MGGTALWDEVPLPEDDETRSSQQTHQREGRKRLAHPALTLVDTSTLVPAMGALAAEVVPSTRVWCCGGPLLYIDFAPQPGAHDPSQSRTSGSQALRVTSDEGGCIDLPGRRISTTLSRALIGCSSPGRPSADCPRTNEWLVLILLVVTFLFPGHFCHTTPVKAAPDDPLPKYP